MGEHTGLEFDTSPLEPLSVAYFASTQFDDLLSAYFVTIFAASLVTVLVVLTILTIRWYKKRSTPRVRVIVPPLSWGDIDEPETGVFFSFEEEDDFWEESGTDLSWEQSIPPKPGTGGLYDKHEVLLESDESDGEDSSESCPDVASPEGLVRFSASQAKPKPESAVFGRLLREDAPILMSNCFRVLVIDRDDSRSRSIVESVKAGFTCVVKKLSSEKAGAEYIQKVKKQTKEADPMFDLIVLSLDDENTGTLLVPEVLALKEDKIVPIVGLLTTKKDERPREGIVATHHLPVERSVLLKSLWKEMLAAMVASPVLDKFGVNTTDADTLDSSGSSMWTVLANSIRDTSLPLIRDGLKSGNLDKVFSATHSVKPALAGAFLMPAAACCTEMEFQAKFLRDLEACKAFMPTFEAVMKKLVDRFCDCDVEEEGEVPRKKNTKAEVVQV